MKQATTMDWVAQHRGAVVELGGMLYEISTARGTTVVLIGVDEPQIVAASLARVTRAWVAQNALPVGTES